MKKTVSNTTSKEKTHTAQSRGQIRKDLQCILGACSHAPTNKSCAYWSKVVDSDDPAAEQLKLIEKIIRSIK